MLIGEVVEKWGFLSLCTSPGVFYPLDGNSGLAADFVEAFGHAQAGDVGKLVYRVRGVLQMENEEQRAMRQQREKTE